MSDLFERAKERVKIEDYLAQVVGSANVASFGDERRSFCPMCSGGKKTGSRPFRVRRGKQSFTCFGCEKFGDVVQLHAELGRMTPAEAARELAGADYTPAEAAPEPVREEAPDDKAMRILAWAADTWRGTGPLLGSLGETYLLGRKIHPWVISLCSARVRFHPAAKHRWDPRARVWITAPALVLKVVTAGGWAGGVHVTYLKPDGSAKTEVEPAKRMIGPQGEHSERGSRPGGALLLYPQFEDDPVLAGADMVTGEGLETVMSLMGELMARGKWPLVAAAALALDRLQGGIAVDAGGCMDVVDPKPNPKRPAFTWPPMADGAGVYIGIDMDMGVQRRRGRTGRGKIVDFELDATARGRMCARLAKAAWLAAGWAWARPMWPGTLSDWNDRVRGAAA